jgi:predicted metalloprotease with PDZ domain
MATSDIWPPMVKKLDDESPLELMDHPTWRDGMAPSDIASFIPRKIPGLFFFTGTHVDYHRPTDTADKINYDEERQIIDLAARVVADLSRRKTIRFTTPPPRTQPATRPATTRSTQPTTQPRGASLGVIPDYGEEGQGVKLAGATPGTPAETAGIKPGDYLIRFGDRAILNIYDLTDALNAADPGQKVKLRVRRGGKEVELEATLAERRQR